MNGEGEILRPSYAFRPTSLVSIDPGTRNLSFCKLTYTPPEGESTPTSTEAFLRCITLTNFRLIDLGSNYIPHSSGKLCRLLRDNPDLEWITSDDVTDIVIEKQGSIQSNIVNFCYTLHGLFLGKFAFDGRSFTDIPSIRLDYEAANKFRGPWIFVDADPSSRVALEPESSTLTSRSRNALENQDPVKRAAVKTAERLLCFIQHNAECIDAVRVERRQHDLCDSLVQGVSYLFRKHVQTVLNPDRTARCCPRVTLPIEGPITDETQAMLLLPRPGRMGSKTSTVMSDQVLKRMYNTQLWEARQSGVISSSVAVTSRKRKLTKAFGNKVEVLAGLAEQTRVSKRTLKDGTVKTYGGKTRDQLMSS